MISLYSEILLDSEIEAHTGIPRNSHRDRKKLRKGSQAAQTVSPSTSHMDAKKIPQESQEGHTELTQNSHSKSMELSHGPKQQEK